MEMDPGCALRDDALILDPSSLEDKNLGEQPEARVTARDDSGKE